MLIHKQAAWSLKSIAEVVDGCRKTTRNELFHAQFQYVEPPLRQPGHK